REIAHVFAALCFLAPLSCADDQGADPTNRLGGGKADTTDDAGPADGGSDASSGPATAFRVRDLFIPHPHLFLSLIRCFDVTHRVNDNLSGSLQGDKDGDGKLDLSPLVVFRPLARTSAQTALEFSLGDCTAPETSSRCRIGTRAMTTFAHNQASGQCLGIL